MAASIPCSVVANKVVMPTSIANVGMKRWRSIAPIRTGMTLLPMSARPITWMTTFSTINGRLQTQSAFHALISTAFICDILSRLWLYLGKRNASGSGALARHPMARVSLSSTKDRRKKVAFEPPICLLEACQLMWFHSQAMWFWESSYSRSMWFENERCYRSGPFMFSVRYS